MIRKITLFIVLLCFALGAIAQELKYEQGRLIVQLPQEVEIEKWLPKYRSLKGVKTDLAIERELVKGMNIWLLSFDFTTINEHLFLTEVRRDEEILNAQFNHHIDYRITPNDTDFNAQWQYLNTGQSGGTPGVDLDADLAWDVTTGGLTAEGDTIVVCVIDGGVDIDHEDLAPILWKNHAEIPNNGIDDDNNGFIDDYLGWNVDSDDDNIDYGTHGTPVTGIVGAKGNNNVGVTGVSWDVQVMHIKDGNGLNEASVLEAYSYPLIMRKRYNATNGEQGAFVVATNASWGIDNAQPEDAPIWCAFYDTLGVAGILNCGATTNSNTNVDIDGDLPTTCTSDYLIAVTNVNHTDNKVANAGYGATSIDLGAFGEGTYTTKQNGNYGTFGGTSGATPHVSGAIGLLYSAPCEGFISLAKASPAEATLLMKAFILNGVDANASLSGITTTEGRLNINNSMSLLMENCGGCYTPNLAATTDYSDTHIVLEWAQTDFVNTVNMRWRAEGTTNWMVVNNASSPYTLNDLAACTNYEIQFETHCDDETIDYSGSTIVKTDGCCENPTEVSTLFVFETQASVQWNAVLAAASYELRYRENGTTNWITVPSQNTSFPIPNLVACTTYEVQVRSICALNLPFGDSFYFMTNGCGSCIDNDYCEPVNLNADDEWIETFSFANLSNTSGNNEGYMVFPTIGTIGLVQGGSYRLYCEAGYAGTPYAEDVHMWIDYDKNGGFNASELLYEKPMSNAQAVDTILVIDENAALGQTRLRVVQQYNNVSGDCPTGATIFGEAEDYCVEIFEVSACQSPSEIVLQDTTHEAAYLTWEEDIVSTEYIVEYRKQGEINWQMTTTTSNNVTISGLDICTDYECRVKSTCGGFEAQNLLTTFEFTTSCVVAAEDLPHPLSAWSLYPNPVGEQLIIALELDNAIEHTQLRIYNSTGALVDQYNYMYLPQGQQEIRINAQAWTAGVYWLSWELADGRQEVKKVIKL